MTPETDGNYLHETIGEPTQHNLIGRLLKILLLVGAIILFIAVTVSIHFSSLRVEKYIRVWMTPSLDGYVALRGAMLVEGEEIKDVALKVTTKSGKNFVSDHNGVYPYLTFELDEKNDPLVVHLQSKSFSEEVVITQREIDEVKKNISQGLCVSVSRPLNFYALPEEVLDSPSAMNSAVFIHGFVAGGRLYRNYTQDIMLVSTSGEVLHSASVGVPEDGNLPPIALSYHGKEMLAFLSNIGDIGFTDFVIKAKPMVEKGATQNLSLNITRELPLTLNLYSASGWINTFDFVPKEANYSVSLGSNYADGVNCAVVSIDNPIAKSVASRGICFVSYSSSMPPKDLLMKKLDKNNVLPAAIVSLAANNEKLFGILMSSVSVDDCEPTLIVDTLDANQERVDTMKREVRFICHGAILLIGVLSILIAGIILFHNDAKLRKTESGSIAMPYSRLRIMVALLTLALAFGALLFLLENLFNK